MDILKDKDKRKGLIGTIAFHLLLLLVFTLYGLTYTYPPPEEGILINFGTSDQGSGDIQPEVSGEVSTTDQQPVENEASTSAATEEGYMTQEESPVALPQETEEERLQRLADEKRQQEEEAFEKQMSDIWSKAKQSGGSEGETGKSGDQGDPDGDKSAKSHIGGKGGKGYNFSLKGRSLLSMPRISDQSQEDGIVVVTIIVDRKGNVVRASPGTRGTTTSAKNLWAKAKKAALEAQFSSNLYSPEEQRGSITFIFVLE